MVTMNFAFVLIYFWYGLAFFSMGLILLLEFSRSVKLREARLLLPLGVFGLVHGIHEWLEMILGVFGSLEINAPPIWPILRIGLLVFSFATLIGYGMQVLSAPSGSGSRDLVVGSAMLIIYLISLLAIGAFPTIRNGDWVFPSEVIARYLLATPGAFLASMALRKQSLDFESSGRESISKNLRGASIGFAIYGVTQFLGPVLVPLTEKFAQNPSGMGWAHLPIPGIRATLAVVITLWMIRMTQGIEQERRDALRKAQEEKFHALETVQAEMEKHNTLRKELLQYTVVMQEEERARVSRELHDETAQLLTGFSANLEALRKLEFDRGSSVVLIDRLANLTNLMSSSIYKLVHDLRPAQLDEMGIHAALTHLIDFSEKNLGLDISFEYNDICKRFDPDLETVIYRIVQESLTNVARYAGVNKAQVSIMVLDQIIEIKVVDEGVGFDVGYGLTQGYGLMGLSERVNHLGGDIKIESEDGIGTSVCARFRLDEPC